MPLYVYEAKDSAKSCAKCRGGFEITQSLKDDKLSVCPDCGSPIYRVIQAPGLTHTQTDQQKRTKRDGFKCLKKIKKGEYGTIY